MQVEGTEKAREGPRRGLGDGSDAGMKTQRQDGVDDRLAGWSDGAGSGLRRAGRGPDCCGRMARRVIRRRVDGGGDGGEADWFSWNGILVGRKNKGKYEVGRERKGVLLAGPGQGSV